MKRLIKRRNPISLVLTLVFSLWISLFASSVNSAVILQYHHVSDSTPKSTSISPAQFAKHIQYLHDNNFKVVPLSALVESVQKQQPLPDKSVAITFDDAYLNVLENAQPILERFNYPYTIFVNPKLIKNNSTLYLSWQQLKTLANKGVIIANHTLHHQSLARKPNNISMADWLAEQSQQLLEAEQIITQKTGQAWQYLAYPYGEFTPEVQQTLAALGFIAFSQQSGAVGMHTDLTNVPRFPASQPYDQLTNLRTKLLSLPLDIKPAPNRNKKHGKEHTNDREHLQTVVQHQAVNAASFTVKVTDFYPKQLNCYISGLGKQTIEWQGKEAFTINFNGTLPVGRTRSNCTAPSISKPGRYYWYSKGWFVLKPNGEWFKP